MEKVAEFFHATRRLERATRDVRELERMLADAKEHYAFALEMYETLREEIE